MVDLSLWGSSKLRHDKTSFSARSFPLFRIDNDSNYTHTHTHTMASTQPTIDLFRGWPSPSLLPTSALSTASQTTFSTPSISTPGMMYGPDPGYEPLRIHTAEWLTRFYQPREPVTSARICVTGGASQNLACILQVFTDPVYTRHVWMVAPTYYLACRIMDDAGFAGRLRAVPEDEEGLDVGFLRKRLEEAESRVDAEYGNHEPV